MHCIGALNTDTLLLMARRRPPQWPRADLPIPESLTYDP